MCNHLRKIMKNQIVPAALKVVAAVATTTAISNTVSILFTLLVSWPKVEK
jgi:hypothetical protein